MAVAGPGPARAQAAGQAVGSTLVRAAVLRPATWRPTIALAAMVDAEQNAALAAERGGRVVAVLFHSGQSVPAGALLVQLDDGPEAAQLALDQARLSQAGHAQERTAKLMTIAGASQAALEQAQADQAEARAQVSLDQANLKQLQIVAPFAGRLGIRKVAAGDYVQQGQTVASIAQSAPLRVLFSVPQTEAGGLAVGDTFTLSAPALPEQAATVTGRLTALSPMLDAATNARDAEGVVSGAADGLLPGMFGTVSLATGTPLAAFAVPATALNDDALGRYVFVIDRAKAGETLRAVYVTAYGAQGEDTLIAGAGLDAGELVVALGGFKLTDGASVETAAP